MPVHSLYTVNRNLNGPFGSIFSADHQMMES
jgi:hypothetical protein